MYSNKTILITGCSKGFGYLFALSLARAGFQVAATSRSLSRMQELADTANKEKLPIKFYELDVTISESIKNAIKHIVQDFNHIDVLINNAGYGLVSHVEHVSPREIKDQFDTNVFGLVEVSQAVIPFMKENRSGHIINISSAAAAIVLPSMGIYAASKWAVEAISEAMYLELRPDNINISLIEPGPYHTSFGASSVRNENMEINSWQKQKKKLQGPFFREPQEVADLVVRIVKSRQPRLRYAPGLPAKLGFFVRKILPQELFIRIEDFLIRM
ncbi:MAG: SDR family oxidoreductase [Candidatus Margulisiibacteriota bacterium]